MSNTPTVSGFQKILNSTADLANNIRHCAKGNKQEVLRRWKEYVCFERHYSKMIPFGNTISLAFLLINYSLLYQIFPQCLILCIRIVHYTVIFLVNCLKPFSRQIKIRRVKFTREIFLGSKVTPSRILTLPISLCFCKTIRLQTE